MDWNNIAKLVENTVTGVGLQILGAIVLYVVGRWLISVGVRLMQRALSQQQIEPTLLRFVGNTVSVILNITLVIAILGYFGVQTTSFAALLAGAGLAIGTAWGGLLANFAAGVFLVVLRPFKAGDFISGGGVTGTVEAVGLFVTEIDTPDNVRTYVANNKLFSDNLQNYTTNPYRRVDLAAQVSGSADLNVLLPVLKQRIQEIPNVAAQPEPDVVIASFTPAGPVLAIRPYTHNQHYWQVYFDTNRAVHDILSDSRYPAPMPVYGIQQVTKAAAQA